MKIVEEKPITIVEAKEILEKKEKERTEELTKAAPEEKKAETEELVAPEGKAEEEAKEKAVLGYEQKVTLDHLRRFATTPKEDIERAKKELIELGILKEHQMVAFLNMLPRDEDEANVILMKERLALEKEQIAKILSIINSIRPAKK